MALPEQEPRPTVRELETALRAAGLSRAQAKSLLSGGLPALDMQPAADPDADADEWRTAVTRLIAALRGDE